MTVPPSDRKLPIRRGSARKRDRRVDFPRLLRWESIRDATAANIAAAMSPAQHAMSTTGRVCARCARIVRIDCPLTNV